MINERSRLYNPAAKGWNFSKFINFLPAAVQDIPGISHEAANLIINATSIREYGVAYPPPRNDDVHPINCCPRGIHKRENFILSSFRFLRLYPATVCKYRLSRVWMVEFLPQFSSPLPPLPRFSIPGKIDEKAFYTGDERFPRAPLTSKRGIF